jgi:hypothetical protein
MLHAVEGSSEQCRRCPRTSVLMTLCRSHGLRPYRHRRQHAGQLSVLAPLNEHDAQWSPCLAPESDTATRSCTRSRVRSNAMPRPYLPGPLAST